MCVSHAGAGSEMGSRCDLCLSHLSARRRHAAFPPRNPFAFPNFPVTAARPPKGKKPMPIGFGGNLARVKDTWPKGEKEGERDHPFHPRGDFLMCNNADPVAFPFTRQS